MRIMKTLMLTALVLGMVGCIQYSQDLTLNKDGSGSVSLHYAMSTAMIQQMDAVKSMGQESDKEGGKSSGSVKFSNDALKFDKEKIQKEFDELKSQGINLNTLKKYDKEGWRHVEVAFSFKDVSTLSKTSYFKDNDMQIIKNAKGNYEIHAKTKGDDKKSAKEGKKEAKKELTAEEKAQADAMKKMMLPMLKGFAVSITFHTPTKIISTTAPEKSKNMARWAFDLEKDADAMDKMEESDMVIVFSGKGVHLNELK